MRRACLFLLRVPLTLAAVAISLAGCSASSASVHSCSEASPSLAGAPCSGFTYCDGCPHTYRCEEGVLQTEIVPYPCNMNDSGAPDASPDASSVDSASDFDAGGVHSCDEAFAALRQPNGTIACSTSCDTGVGCDGFTFCAGCPYQLACVSGMIHVYVSGVICDSGPRPDSAATP